MASRKLFFVKPKYIYPQPESEISENDDDNVFEFDESDIHNLGDHQLPSSFDAKKSILISRLRRKPTKTGDSNGSSNLKTTKTGSLPVNIPDWSKILKSEYRSHAIPDDDSDEDDEEDDDVNDGGRRMIPPHEYLARRRGSSFTMHDGIGGTAKGRDLRRLRNLIWEKIGFQD
ncbi:Protein S40-4 [Cardamine amara subsp. amara]|uniref:Protein S40-4 n=1 Tax=Cardamine amara subsp. amara TaxID=228776 RepID=A0ABD1C121_CARAN